MKTKSNMTVEIKNIDDFIEKHKEQLTVQMIDELAGIEEDGRKTKKYDIENQIPVGSLSMLFSPSGDIVRELFKENHTYEVINTKNGEIKGHILFDLIKQNDKR